MKPAISDQHIIDHLNNDYDIEVVKLTRLSLGADINAAIYKAQAQDQSAYFVKLKRGHHHDISIATVEFLRDAGIQPIIFPIKTVHAQPTQHIDEFTLIVYPFIQGQDGFNRPLTDEQWLILGKTLRQVHEMNVPLSLQNQIRRETYSSKWREVVRSLYTHIEAEQILPDEIGLKVLAFMKKNTMTIHRLVDSAEQLAQKLKNEPHTFVLCHSDIHAGNVLMSKNNMIHIVDWDEPIMAPKERDLMFIGGGVGNSWNKPQEEALFYQGYGKSEINVAILAYYRHERVVEDIAFYGQNLLLTTTGGDDRLEMYKHFIDMFAPKGVVDIAFKTGYDF
jgi:spectinomycin phosphotransferase